MDSNEVLKFNTLKEAQDYLSDTPLTSEQLKKILTCNEIDGFTRLLIAVSIEVEFEEFLSKCMDDPRIKSLWDNTYFKRTLVKTPKEYVSLLKMLINDDSHTLRDELGNQNLDDNEKIYIINALDKMPNVSTAKELTATFDKDVADFLIQSHETPVFHKDLLKIKLDIPFDCDKYPANLIAPFLTDKEFIGLFNKSSLTHLRELLNEKILDEATINSLKDVLIGSLGVERILSEIKAMSSTTHDGVLVDLDTMLVDYESEEKNTLVNLLLPIPFIKPSDKELIIQASAARAPININLEINNESLQLAYHQKENPLIQHFFLNCFMQSSSILKRMPMNSLAEDQIAGLFSGKSIAKSSLIDDFEATLAIGSDRKNNSILLVKMHLDKVAEELQEVFAVLPNIQGRTNFSFKQEANTAGVSAQLVLDDNIFSITSEGDNLILGLKENESSLIEMLPELVISFVNNLNNYIQEGSN